MKNWIFFSGVLILLLAVKFSPLSSIILEFSSKIFDPKIKTISKETNQEILDLDLIGFNASNNNLQNLNKDKPVFINFWGTWCPPCIAEMPSIQKLYEKHKEKVNFVMIVIRDRNEELGDISKFLKDRNFSFTVYDTDSPIHENIYPKQGIPTTLIT